MIKENMILDMPYQDAVRQRAAIQDFFRVMALDAPLEEDKRSLREIFKALNNHTLQELGLIRENLPEQLLLFLEHVQQQGKDFTVHSISILGGKNKSNEPENITLRLEAGEVVSVVGATGSGKSRLLADIEWMAQGDTPTGRRILINDQIPPAQWRYAIEKKLVAQLSQNMNFVMDLTVGAFIDMHGQSRMVDNLEEKKRLILQEANCLAGEPIREDMPVTALSGGQSRALMIADTAFLSLSPIVLIDEIENAGIDRRTAVELLIQKEKIVVIATHDPVLALMAKRRLVLENGGIARIYETSAAEQQCLIHLESMNHIILGCREKLRKGEKLSLKDLGNGERTAKAIFGENHE